MQNLEGFNIEHRVALDDMLPIDRFALHLLSNTSATVSFVTIIAHPDESSFRLKVKFMELAVRRCGL